MSTSTGFRDPRSTSPFHGRKLDAFWPEYGLIVECDGWDTHRTREAFESDRERDTDHLDYGLTTVRLTKRRLEQTPDHEAARFKRILKRLAG